MTTTEPTDDQINEAIAKWMGFTEFHKLGDDTTVFGVVNNCATPVPRYTTDLNAVAEVVDKLSSNDGLVFRDTLERICAAERKQSDTRLLSILIINSTARQRALAIVRTLNLLNV